MPKVHRFLVVAGCLVVLVAGWSAVTVINAKSDPAGASTVPAGFVHREGHELRLDGQLYRFVGFNAFGMTGCATGTAWTDSELDTYFGNLPPAAMTRTWAFAGYGVQRLERVVARAEAHGQKLILSLANSSADCTESHKDTAWYGGGYRADYLPWVRTVVTRFKDSPAVGMWEIMNEPGHQSTVSNTTMKAFFDTAAATIKSVDPNHLVGTGSMAAYTPGTTDFALVHSGPDIDVGSLHEYDQDHTDVVLSRQLPLALDPLYRLDKPLIVGETGILAGPGCPISLQQRADMFRRELDGYFLSGVAGVLIWTYSPHPRTESTCMHQVRQPDTDPTIGMVRSYRQPDPGAAPPRFIEARASGKCLTVPNGSTANRAVVEQRPCGTATHQQFTLQPTSDGFYQLVAAHSGKCLEVADQSYSLDAQVQQQDCGSGSHQQFRLEPLSGGFYHLVTRHSVRCLRFAGGSAADGARLTQYDCKPGLTSPQFRIR